MKLHLRIVSPSRNLLDKDVDMVIMRTVNGDMGILPNHEPVIAALGYGALKIRDGEEEIIYSVLGGYAEVLPDRVTIMSDAAERMDEIDIQRAMEAKERALRQLEEKDDAADHRAAERNLRRALVRLDVSSYPLLKDRK